MIRDARKLKPSEIRLVGRVRPSVVALLGWLCLWVAGAGTPALASPSATVPAVIQSAVIQAMLNS